eukprot:COSAG05_NODE_2107_length_3551_cov_3.251738_3_plen_57_part_00
MSWSLDNHSLCPDYIDIEYRYMKTAERCAKIHQEQLAAGRAANVRDQQLAQVGCHN